MQWHMPIGYRVIEGKISIDENKEQIVKEIFQEYANGKTATSIAKDLIEREIPNGNGSVTWTHTSVGRILENCKYLGTEYYPQLIEQALYNRVQELREQTRVNLGRGKYRAGTKERGLLQGKVICGECGGVYGRYQTIGRGKRKILWRCHNYIYHNKKFCQNDVVDDQVLFDVCTAALNAVIQNPRLLNRVEKKERIISKRYRELEKQIQTENIQSREEMIKIIQERAAEAYRGLQVDDTSIQTKRIKKVLEGKEKLKEFDENLFLQTIDKIIVNPDKTIKVVFQNTGSYETEYKE